MDLSNRGGMTLAVGGGAAALAAGALIAWSIVGRHEGEPRPPPPASKGGLVIDSSSAPDTRVAATRPLRCFVAGQSVGELTLAECAKRNGVATDALDVGVDRTGALAAAQQGGAAVTPLPPAEVAVPVRAPETTHAPAVLGACWRYEGGWRKLPNDLSLAGCVQTLFNGRCEKAGQALYGRWAQQTIRLVPGKVEISGDNRSFRTLIEQGANCSIPGPG